MGKFTFAREERLKKEKHIQELFSKGSSFYLFPFKVLILVAPDPNIRFPQLLISVSKKKFKTAVARNAIKRRIREAYRLNKNLLPVASPLQIGLVYSHHEMLASKEISEKMVHVFRKISRLPISSSNPA